MKRLKRRIGVKYCGGCNPSYDRIEAVKRLAETLGGEFEFVRHDAKGLAALLIVNGCPTRCADKDADPKHIPVLSMDGDTDFGFLVQWMRSF